MKEVMQDPSKAVDFENDVIEENINLLLVSNEAHANVEISYKNRDLERIKTKTVEMLNKLKEQSETQRKAQMNALRRSQASNLAKCLVGDRCEYIVGQFIAILKKRVMERQEETLKRKNAAMVDSIIKK